MIYGRFIGIDRFMDADVPDLAGCARDATALYSVFQDGVPEMDGQLIVNEQATIGRVRELVRETLATASAQDAVILTFATHGTQDHRIVAHDSSLAELSGTTFALDDLVDAFRASAARFIFVILDCCFAGAAPARVVANTPRARTIVDLASFQGTGKLLLAASRMDEPAYEHPQRRHGLLTAALLDALTDHHQAGVMAMVESVIARVRADAAAIGVVQHPVATTYVDGGFRLPVLVRGATFTVNFPEYGAVTTQDINGIAAFGIPADIVHAWSTDYGNHLHQLQRDAINEYRVLDSQSVFVVAPTSSGKTFIGELAAIKAIGEGRKAVFLLPYKALVSEKYEDFEAKYGDRLGLRVIRCNSDYRDQTTQFSTGKFDIAVLTYEMFLGLTIAQPAVLNLLGLVVLDEAQFIADDERGITVELILTFLRLSRTRGINPQLVLLSAVLGNVNSFAQWLDLRALVSTVRPVPLDFGVLDRNGVFEYQDDDGNRRIEQLLSPIAIRQRRDKPSAQDVIVPLARQLLENPTERLIIFRNRRGETEGSTGYLSAELGLPPAQGALAALPQGDRSTSSAQLGTALRGGVAFHTSNLDAPERAVVERSFRNPAGGIRVLTSTSGMAAGINTPASTVLIVETTQPKSGGPPMSAAVVRNMAGRAGRYGLQERGRAVILATNSLERARLFNAYVLSTPDPIRSTFDAREISTWVLRLLRQVTRVPRAEVPTLVVNTFGGYLASLANPGFAPVLAGAVTGLLGRMLGAGLLEEDEHGVALTMLGRACGASSLTFESCLRLIEAARRIGPAMADPQSLVVLLQVLEEGDGIYVPLQGKGSAEGRWQAPFRARFGNALAAEIARFAPDHFTIWRRQKRALIAAAWMGGVPIERIERDFSVNFVYAVGAGDVRGIAESIRFRIRSAFEIIAAAVPDNAPDPEAVDVLLLQLEFGVPAEALFLVRFPGTLTRADILAIANAGLRSMEQIQGITPEELGQILPRDLVEKLKVDVHPAA
jgi:replicative superfamily II helicase